MKRITGVKGRHRHNVSWNAGISPFVAEVSREFAEIMAEGRRLAAEKLANRKPDKQNANSESQTK